MHARFQIFSITIFTSLFKLAENRKKKLNVHQQKNEHKLFELSNIRVIFKAF